MQNDHVVDCQLVILELLELLIFVDLVCFQPPKVLVTVQSQMFRFGLWINKNFCHLSINHNMEVWPVQNIFNKSSVCSVSISIQCTSL